MDMAIYLSGKLVLLVALTCMILGFRIGRVSMSLMLVCVVFTGKVIVDGYFENQDLKSLNTLPLFAFWYVTFNATNLLAIAALYTFHVTLPVRFCLAARFYIWKCVIASVIILCRCLERVYSDLNNFEFLYLWVAPSTNYLFIGVLVYSLYAAYTRAREFGERIAWNI